MNKERLVFPLGLVGVSVLTVFGGTLINTLIPPAYAEDSLGTIDPSKYSISIASASKVQMKLETLPNTSVVRSGKDTVTTTITAPTGNTNKFNLYLSTNSANNTLVNGTNTIPATSGTFTSPVALTGNAWGFALAKNTTGIPTNGFDESYSTPVPATDSKWAAVPTKGNEQLIQTLPMNQPSTSTDVYYAISADYSLAEGSYTNDIVYTAIYEASDIPTGEMTLSPDIGAAGDEITLNTSVVPTMADFGTLDVKFEDPSSNAEYPCENIVPSKTAQGNLQVKCKVPTLPSHKDYSVIATYSKTGAAYTATQMFTYGKTFDQVYKKAGKTKATATDGNQYYKMQDMDSNICNTVQAASSTAAADTQTTQLVDTRDGKTYYVAKLFDGKCWMTQNLDLDITTAGFTNADTDLNSKTSWDASSSYAPKTTETTSSSSSSLTDTRSWSLGDVYYDGTTSTACADTTSYASCIGKGINTTGDKHYHVGNLYQWNTATAGSGGTLTSGDASDSICPKGWRLPSYASSIRDFNTLLTKYGAWTSGTTGNLSKIIPAPIYIGRPGRIASGKLNLAANLQTTWTSTPWSNGTNSYNFMMHSANYADVAHGNERYYGNSVRCLAR